MHGIGVVGGYPFAALRPRVGVCADALDVGGASISGRFDGEFEGYFDYHFGFDYEGRSV